MDRRNFTLSCLSTIAASGSLIAHAQSGDETPLQSTHTQQTQETDGKIRVAILLFEGVTALDFIGPATILSASGKFIIDYVWRDKNPVYMENGPVNLGMLPTATFDEIRETDVLCIPGTSNPYQVLVQTDVIDWVKHIGNNASWVTSVCTGSLILGAAGLLQNYKATSHWSMIDDLRYFGATPTPERVVFDRNRITGAGVTSGMDFGLALLIHLCGEDTARVAQLFVEYDPDPPLNGGSPKTADPTLLAFLAEKVREGRDQNAPYAQKYLEETAQRLGVTVK